MAERGELPFSPWWLVVAAANAGLGLAFVALLGAAVFLRSPMFSAFPPLVGEYYGLEHSSTNFALLYTGKLWGGVGGGVVASALVASAGWTPTVLGGAALVSLAGLLTLLLRPVE